MATNSTSRFEFDTGIDSTATRKGRNSLFPTPPRVSPKSPVHTSQKLTKREVTWPFRRKDDKVERPQPALRLNSSSSTLLPPAIPRVIAREPSDDFDLLPDYDDSDDDDTRAFRRSPATSNKKKMYRNAFSMSNLKKSCSNLAALKSKSKSTHSSLYHILDSLFLQVQSESNMISTPQVPASSTATREPTQDRRHHHPSPKSLSTSQSRCQRVTLLSHNHHRLHRLHHHSSNAAATAHHAPHSKRPKALQVPSPAQLPHPKTQPSPSSSTTSPLPPSPPLSPDATGVPHSALRAPPTHTTTH